jgi:hypothetical protein
MPGGRQEQVTLETNTFGGINTALQFSQIPREQSPLMINATMKKIDSISQRDGTIPVTATALSAPIEHLTVYRSSPTVEDILAASGTTLYKFNEVDTLLAQNMTNPLVKADIYTVAFTDENNVSVLFITDGGNMKQYNGIEVKDIVAAADDPLPNPPNDLININAKKPLYCWVYSSHVFVSYGTDIAHYTKRFEYDYIPSVQFERWVRENDYMTGPGIEFNGLCLIPMRKGWGILTGSNFNNFNGNQFINTINGCIAPRSIQRITYPDGRQTIAYLSDDGAHEIYDTGNADSSNRYSTQSLMNNKIDFEALGLSEVEKKGASAYFDVDQFLYILTFKRGTDNLAYAYNTRNGEWYPWTNIVSESMVRKVDTLYYAGSEGNLRKFDEDLYSDWNESTKETGTPVYFKRYSPAISFEFSGYSSYWDYYLLEAKQWNVTATLDIGVVFSNTTVELLKALKNEIFVEGVTKWGEGKYANVDYTDIVNEPNELIFHKKSKYVQVIWENNRDEPVEIYKERWKGRISGR